VRKTTMGVREGAAWNADYGIRFIIKPVEALTGIKARSTPPGRPVCKLSPIPAGPNF